MNKEVKVQRALAPKRWDVARVIHFLKLDPFQTRVSKYPILLTHPRTGKRLPLKEFIEDVVGDARVAIEAEDGLVFISRLENSAVGVIFVPMAVAPKSAIEKKQDPKVTLK